MQCDFARKGSIMQGELTQLLTAMGNRAYKPMKKKRDNSGIDYYDSGDDDFFDCEGVGEPPGLAFKYEQRTPVSINQTHIELFTETWMISTNFIWYIRC
jgi:hypothetical protein